MFHRGIETAIVYLDELAHLAETKVDERELAGARA
jgi:hypothetical protein